MNLFNPKPDPYTCIQDLALGRPYRSPTPPTPPHPKHIYWGTGRMLSMYMGTSDPKEVGTSALNEVGTSGGDTGHPFHEL